MRLSVLCLCLCSSVAVTVRFLLRLPELMGPAPSFPGVIIAIEFVRIAGSLEGGIGTLLPGLILTVGAPASRSASCSHRVRRAKNKEILNLVRDPPDLAKSILSSSLYICAIIIYRFWHYRHTFRSYAARTPMFSARREISPVDRAYFSPDTFFG